ncbi:glycosyltransferase family 1 protein [uncultured Cetobacterium sp.]|uniref:glycosyltransferase family 1 protein n=1 Tax=uncultured Cetobacterium sp. TaxID=527638 RepID=UPI002613EFE1|nr:glycosyltransferase family 1 protein [uncultured Cetobacterium sp.]
MKSDPIRILHVVSIMNMGGIENFIMNIYRNIDRTNIQFDFLVHHEEKGIFEDEIEQLGGKIYRIPFVTKVGHFKYIKYLNEFFKNHREYEIVHSHFNTISGLILKSAKENGVKIRIAHSHIAYPKYRFLENIYKKYAQSFINKVSTQKFACSKLAGEWLYGKGSKFEVINNGVVARKYIYNEEKRQNIRKLLKIEKNDLVLGHIGRFDEQKNHKFLIKVFEYLYKKNQNYKLFLVGDGKLRKELEEEVKNLGLVNNVIFLGIRKDIPDLLQAFDLFVFPSISEGLPVTLVEAQAASLKCFISNSITNEIDLGCNLISFIDLKISIEEWTKVIVNNEKYERQNLFNIIQKSGYDIEQNVKDIEKMYLEMFLK